MISIIIPTLNESLFLRDTITHTLMTARNPDSLEFIVVDAGSNDKTIETLEGLKVRAFSKPGFVFKKNESMNFGASKATGKVILFLDADTILPQFFDEHINHVLLDPDCVGGAFEFAFDQPDWKLQLITLINRIRYRFGKVFYGDQAVFVGKEVLEDIGGVPNEPLMETAFLCKRLRRKGELRIIKPAIKTSPRRFQQYGFFKTSWFDINMFIRFNLGLSVSDYAQKYWSKNLIKRNQ